MKIASRNCRLVLQLAIQVGAAFGMAVGLGVVLYYILPPSEDESRQDGSIRVDKKKEAYFSFCLDGQRILSASQELKWGTLRDGLFRGPYRLRDSFTGKLLAEFGAYEKRYDDTCAARGRRYWAGLPHDEKGILDLVDFETGEERRLPIKPIAGDRQLLISPKQDLVVVLPWLSYGEAHLYELPTGAHVATLTGRFRHPRFASKSSYFLYEGGKREEPELHLWNAGKRQSAGVMPTAEGDWSTSSDGRFLLAPQSASKLNIWDLSDIDRPKLTGDLPRSAGRYYFSPDAETIVQLPPRDDALSSVVFWDLATAREKCRLDPRLFNPDAERWSGAFACGSDLFAFSTRNPSGKSRTGETEFLRVFDVAKQKLLWNLEIPLPSLRFFGKGDTVFLTQDLEAQIRDARSGDLLKSFPLPDSHRIAQPTGDGRYVTLWNEDPPPSDPKRPRLSQVRVIEVPTQSIVFDLVGVVEWDPNLSQDGSTLLTVHYDQAGVYLRCWDVASGRLRWDVPGRRPWFGIIGISAVFFVLLVFLGWWRNARRARRSSEAAALQV
ncbi:MAG: hypothetical protein HY040_09325 [Planctomycetes bacterium]|nr:hypothetical protein [Planctomycetota bacterium]